MDGIKGFRMLSIDFGQKLDKSVDLALQSVQVEASDELATAGLAGLGTSL